ncbi:MULTISPECIES: hypothetical protein [Pantoea]|uniref:hypothetical protein n=1 Tax=Pantoea TaxID=53335 RepID=UPI001D741C70|nr:hypothetical protein [uncultured Pantoea sp.]MBK4770740.1 hypothetical protein [Pantoea sp. Morm]
MKSGLAILILAALLVGCASDDIEDMPRDARVKFANMEGYSNNPYPKARILGEVMGMSCARRAGSSTMVTEMSGNIFATTTGPDVATGSEALENMRYKAAIMGGDAVVNAVCKSGGVDWAHNCWSTVKCVGDVVSKN